MRMVIPLPWLVNFQFRNSFSIASAATQVAMAKYMPRIRNSIRDSSTAASALTSAPAASPRKGEPPQVLVTTATV